METVSYVAYLHTVHENVLHTTQLHVYLAFKTHYLAS